MESKELGGDVVSTQSEGGWLARGECRERKGEEREREREKKREKGGAVEVHPTCAQKCECKLPVSNNTK